LNGAAFRILFVNVFEHPCSEPALLYGRRCCTELSSHAKACGASSVVTVAAAGPTEGADAMADQLRELLLSAVYDAAAPVPPRTLHLQFAMPLHGTTSRVACDVRSLTHLPPSRYVPQLSNAGKNTSRMFECAALWISGRGRRRKISLLHPSASLQKGNEAMPKLKTTTRGDNRIACRW